MAVLTTRHRGCFETTKRLLAQLVNEGLVIATSLATDSEYRCQLIIHGSQECGAKDIWIKTNVRPDTFIDIECGRVLPILRPESLLPPVILGGRASEEEIEELDPSTIFRFIFPWLKHIADEALLETMADQLRNTAENQEQWLDRSQSQSPLLSLNSPMIAWEQSLVFGHQTHPFHRLCWANPLLDRVLPQYVAKMLAPSLAFVSVPHADMRVTGPFEVTLEPLLEKLGILKQNYGDKLIVPCLAQQLPAIFHHFPNSVFIREIPCVADAQASMRTITLRPELGFNYHMKLSLACQITSAVRTITPWTTGQGSAITELLEKVLPADLWVFREVAAISGRQEDFDAAKHLSCVFREDLEPRAKLNNEALVVAAALIEQHPADGHTYPERLFNLETVGQRKAWFKEYLSCLFRLMLHPLINHGIALEAHHQNVVVRICRDTGRIKGFAIRDFGGVKFHKPTLRSQGFNLDWEIPGSLTLTDDLSSVWNITSHSLLQSHAASLLYALRLEKHGGWAVIQEELSNVLTSSKAEAAKGLLEYFRSDTVVLKSFLNMIIKGLYRENLEVKVPNPLVRYSSLPPL